MNVSLLPACRTTLFILNFTAQFLGLKFLVRLCTDLGLKETQDYANKLKRAEKAAKMREEVCNFFKYVLPYFHTP